MRDLYSNIAVRPALAPSVTTAAANGTSIDTKGFNRIAFAVNTGAIVGDGDFGVKLQESADGSTGWADVAAAFVDSNAPATLAANSSYKAGYRGHQRYVRLATTKAGGTSIAIGAVAILGDPADAPVA